MFAGSMLTWYPTSHSDRIGRYSGVNAVCITVVSRARVALRRSIAALAAAEPTGGAKA